jgi:hypothetical protein
MPVKGLPPLTGSDRALPDAGAMLAHRLVSTLTRRIRAAAIWNASSGTVGELQHL